MCAGWCGRLSPRRSAAGRTAHHEACSSLRRQPHRPPMHRWRLRPAACVPHGVCGEPLGEESVPSQNPANRTRSRPVSPTTSCRSSSVLRVEPWCRRRLACRSRLGRPNVWAGADRHSTGADRMRRCVTGRTRAASSNRRRWRRCRPGIWGARRRGVDDLRRENRGRSHSVRACQGETLASCLLLNDSLLVHSGPLPLSFAGTGRTGRYRQS